MQKIKFRAYYKPKKAKKWQEAGVGMHEVVSLVWKEWLGEPGKNAFVSDTFKVNIKIDKTEKSGFLMCVDKEVELVQYIGLKDKNKTEIYDLDILRDVEGRIAVVRKYDRQYKAVVDGDGTIADFEKEDLLDYVSENYEVVGNILENKELLK